MVKLDTFFLKTQLKYINETLVKKLSQEFKLNEFYRLLKQSQWSVYSSLLSYYTTLLYNTAHNLPTDLSTFAPSPV